MASTASSINRKSRLCFPSEDEKFYFLNNYGLQLELIYLVPVWGHKLIKSYNIKLKFIFSG